MDRKKKILLVDDEPNLLDTITLNLQIEGYDVIQAKDGKEAIMLFNKNKVDLVILDVMLPEMDGFDVCKKIRLENQRVPVLFLTAKGGGQDRIEGLKLGADDYLAKPFNLEELLLRISSLLRRSGLDIKSDDHLFKFGKCSIDYSTFEVKTVKGETKQISKKEIDLLRLLTNNKNKVVSRQEILDKLWGDESFPSSRTIDNYILMFRKYFESDPKAPRHFFSVRGVGYRFVE